VVLDRHGLVRRFALVLGLVAAVDLSSKLVATLLLADGGIRVFGPVDLAVTYNRGSALGLSFGPYTWLLNVVTTAGALVLVAVAIRPLAAVDRRAPVALGLIGGAALGNLASLLVPPAGVADFIAVQVGSVGRVIMNAADIAAYAGLAMLLRSALLVHRAIAARRTVTATRVREVEVPIPLFADSILEARAARLVGRPMSPPAPRPAREARPPERAD
jgi:signal peptidase II